MNILDKINQDLTSFSKSEQKLVSIIVSSPDTVINMSIAKLAEQAQVSEPTVNRLCRKLGTKGYPDFKLHLAKAVANGVPFENLQVNEDDTVEEYTSKIFESTLANLTLAKNHLDNDIINKAVDILTQANRISFFGLGASAVIAFDAQNKFFRFDVPIVYSNDILMQRMSATNSIKGDVIVLISRSGRTKSIIEVAQLAQESNATIIGITNKDSPLAAKCHLVLSVNTAEDTDLYMPMASRITQLMLIDILAAGFTLRRGKKFRDSLKRVKGSLKGSRIEHNE